MSDTEKETDITKPGGIAHLDFITALVLMAVSVISACMAYGYYVKSRKEFYASPGFMPVIIAVILFLLSLSLLFQSLKDSSFKERFRQALGAIPRGLKSKYFKNSIIALGMFAVYIYGLLRLIPFWLSSLILLFGIFAYLKASKIIFCAIIAVLSTGGIVLLFQIAFHVPMP
jgi:hypothetical protein